MKGDCAKFSVGQLIQHRLFGYRGAIFDADPVFQGSDEWYEAVAHSRPPKDQPWYHVLVDGATHTTYVAERNLESDRTGKPVKHPAVDDFFDEFRDGKYIRERELN